MNNTVMCTLNLHVYDVIRITRHLHVKLKSFSYHLQPVHNKPYVAVAAKKSEIMSEALFVDVSIYYVDILNICRKE